MDCPSGRWQAPPVPGYGQYCPIAKASEVLGERWTLLILRDLMTGAHRFNDLYRGLPGISRSLLSERLRRLEHDGLIERRDANGSPAGYWLTPLGADLQPALMAMGEWAARNYGRDPRRDELDPSVLLLWIERNANRDGFPPGRLVVRFDLHGSRPNRAWLVSEDRVPSVCWDDPGFDVDLTIGCDLRTLHKVFAGRVALSAAMRDRSLVVEGSEAQRRAFMHWFGYSPMANATRAALAG